MIRAIRDWRAYRRLRAQWTHDADTGEWRNGNWRIEHVTNGFVCDVRDQWERYRISYMGTQQGKLHRSLRQAIEAVGEFDEPTQQPDFVFRSRQTLRETATASARASIPDWMDDDDADANDRHWRGK